MKAVLGAFSQDLLYRFWTLLEVKIAFLVGLGSSKTWIFNLGQLKNFLDYDELILRPI